MYNWWDVKFLSQLLGVKYLKINIGCYASKKNQSLIAHKSMTSETFYAYYPRNIWCLSNVYGFINSFLMFLLLDSHYTMYDINLLLLCLMQQGIHVTNGVIDMHNSWNCLHVFNVWIRDFFYWMWRVI